MSAKIILFYHCVFYLGNPPELSLNALAIVREQMEQLAASGLIGTASEIIIGINGPVEESRDLASLFLPAKAQLVFHGKDSIAENLTIVEIERWLKTNSGEAYIWYGHCKGASHGPGPVLDMRTLWRRCGMKHLVERWRQCVADLDSGYESVGVHWMTYPKTPMSQSIWAGTFFWAKASFLRTLPSIMERARIKQSGIGSLESRYEAEVWIGNGPRVPYVRDYHGPDWDPSKTATCAYS